MLILFLLFGFTFGDEGGRSLADFMRLTLPHEYEPHTHKERRK
jgi:hypothetical protein